MIQCTQKQTNTACMHLKTSPFFFLPGVLAVSTDDQYFFQVICHLLVLGGAAVMLVLQLLCIQSLFVEAVQLYVEGKVTQHHYSG